VDADDVCGGGTRRESSLKQGWRNRLSPPWGPAGLAVLAIGALVVAGLVILDEDDPPAEAASYNTCEVVINNTSVHDLLLTSQDPTSDDRWASGDPPQTVAANSEARVDFKFQTNTGYKQASLVYTGRNTNVHVTMSWKCIDSLSSQRQKDGQCSTNAGGWVDCEAIKTYATNKYEFTVEDD
jgi:hypothetical protein